MADGGFFIGQPEVLLGVMPGGGGTQRLTRLIGAHNALVAIFEGKAFTLAEALANGAVDYVVPQDEVVARATELAARFGSRVKGSVATIKRSVYFGGSMSLTEGLGVESAEFFTGIPSEAQDRMRNYLETTGAPARSRSATRTRTRRRSRRAACLGAARRTKKRAGRAAAGPRPSRRRDPGVRLLRPGAYESASRFVDGLIPAL